MQRRHQITSLALALCACVASPLLFAATPIDQTRPLDARGKVEIDNLKGRIEVRAWDRNEVHISGSLGAGVEKLVIEGGGDDLVVRVQYPRQANGTEPTLLKLQVPLRASLDIDSVSADIDVDGVASQQLGIETVSGNVVAAAAPRRADIDSVSGDLQLTLNSDDVRVETVSGDAVLKGRLGGEVHGETVSGKLSIDSLGGRLRRLTSGTVSGDTVLAVGLAEGGEIRSETVSGDVLLRMPADLSARVSAESFSGDLEAPGAKIRKEEFGPGSSFEQRYGSGAGDVHIETFSGDATLELR
jgi:hypothetical protein